MLWIGHLATFINFLHCIFGKFIRMKKFGGAIVTASILRTDIISEVLTFAPHGFCLGD